MCIQSSFKSIVVLLFFIGIHGMYKYKTVMSKQVIFLVQLCIAPPLTSCLYCTGHEFALVSEWLLLGVSVVKTKYRIDYNL